jgi:hypothetical protein
VKSPALVGLFTEFPGRRRPTDVMAGFEQARPPPGSAGRARDDERFSLIIGVMGQIEGLNPVRLTWGDLSASLGGFAPFVPR